MMDQNKCPETDPVMQGAWAACLSYTVRRTDALQRFEKETGLKFRPATNGIERMIDQATGFEDDFLEKFIDWFNEKIWGSRAQEIQGLKEALHIDDKT